jgi:hypothetical protein
MTKEIREYGDGKTLVCYTDNSKLYQELLQSQKLIKAIIYEQHYVDAIRSPIGADLYFPRKDRRWLEQKYN